MTRIYANMIRLNTEDTEHAEVQPRIRQLPDE